MPTQDKEIQRHQGQQRHNSLSQLVTTWHMTIVTACPELAGNATALGPQRWGWGSR
jgi:hypothetical protein